MVLAPVAERSMAASEESVMSESTVLALVAALATVSVVGSVLAVSFSEAWASRMSWLVCGTSLSIILFYLLTFHIL